MSRLVFRPAPVISGAQVRVDLEEEDDTPAVITTPSVGAGGDSSLVDRSLLRADPSTGALPAFRGPDGVSTLWVKLLDYSGAVTETVVELTAEPEAVNPVTGGGFSVVAEPTYAGFDAYAPIDEPIAEWVGFEVGNVYESVDVIYEAQTIDATEVPSLKILTTGLYDVNMILEVDFAAPTVDYYKLWLSGLDRHTVVATKSEWEDSGAQGAPWYRGAFLIVLHAGEYIAARMNAVDDVTHITVELSRVA